MLISSKHSVALHYSFHYGAIYRMQFTALRPGGYRITDTAISAFRIGAHPQVTILPPKEDAQPWSTRPAPVGKEGPVCRLQLNSEHVKHRVVVIAL